MELKNVNKFKKNKKQMVMGEIRSLR